MVSLMARVAMSNEAVKNSQNFSKNTAIKSLGKPAVISGLPLTYKAIWLKNYSNKAIQLTLPALRLVRAADFCVRKGKFNSKTFTFCSQSKLLKCDSNGSIS